MIERADSKLIADLARLTRSHTAADFKRLADMLADEGSRRSIIDVLDQLATTTRRRRVKSRKRTPASSEVLTSVEGTDPEKFQILTQFKRAVLAKRLLPEMSQLRDFALNCGVKLPFSKSRERILNHLLGALLHSDSLDLKKKLSEVPSDKDFGQEYQNWVKLILRKHAVGE